MKIKVKKLLILLFQMKTFGINIIFYLINSSENKSKDIIL